MKQLLVAALALIAFNSNPAQAVEVSAPVVEAPMWVCGLEFQGEARGIQILIGSFHSEATGELHCQDRVGNQYNREILITMQTTPLSPTVGIGSFQFVGGAANITLLNNHPRDLFGDYVVAQGRAAVIGGAGAFTAFRVGARDLSLQISTQLVSGLGVEAGFTRMTIERL